MGVLKKIWGVLKDDYEDSKDNFSGSSSVPNYAREDDSDHSCYKCEYYEYHGLEEGCHCNYYNEDEYGLFGGGEFKRHMEFSRIYSCDCTHFKRKD